MRRNTFSPPAVFVSRILLLVLGIAWLPASALAQPQLQDNNLPRPRLNTIMPMGGKIGTTVEVTFTGTDLEDPQELRFSTPGIKAEPIQPPPPPPPDPKKPPTPPPPKPPITKFKVTIAPDTPLGLHDVRFVNKWGISNPRAFVVGDLAEILEKEPNNDVKEAQRVEINSTINGNIANPTDVDYYVFAGKKDQRVVLSCLASTIDSRMHAELELYDAKDKRLAHNRHYLEGDALTDCTLPADGDYYVRLSQFTHTEGTPEHFYRLSITTAPWIDAVYPPMVEPNKPAKVTIYGRNLPGGKPDPTAITDDRVLDQLIVDLPAAPRLPFSGRVIPNASNLDGFEYRIKNASGTSNPYFITHAYAPVVLDNEANDTPETAQVVTAPCEIAGRIEKKGDRDWYSFTAKKGEILNIEVFSERLGAPTDMKVLLRNPASKQTIMEQDDNPDTFNLKFFARTHDPAVYRFTVPADGAYQLLISSVNADVLAGPRHIYRVRITPDLLDFQLVLMPSDNHRNDACTLHQGGCEGYTVFAWRRDGWNGEIALTVEGLPKGVTCIPQTLGTNLRQTELVLTAAADAAPWTGEIKVRGTATIKGLPVVHVAKAAAITWPVQANTAIPTITRMDRALVLAVRDKAPYNLAVTLDKVVIQQGDKANLTLKLARLWPDFKTPLQIVMMDPIPNLTVNNNQPVNIAADKVDATAVLDAKANLAPGTYNIILRTQAQLPYNKDPMAKQKPNINVVLPAMPVTVTVLPKTVGTVALVIPDANIKVGAQAEVTVKVVRLLDYAGEFKLELVLPPNIKGFSADPVTIPAGQNEAKLILKVAADAPLGNRPDLIVRAVAPIKDAITAIQEAKLNVTVIK